MAKVLPLSQWYSVKKKKKTFKKALAPVETGVEPQNAYLKTEPQILKQLMFSHPENPNI